MNSSSDAAPLHASEPKLTLFAQALDRILRSGRVGSSDYKVFICDGNSLTNSNGKGKGMNNNNPLNYMKATSKYRVINYWCFSTGVALQELSKLGVRSIVVTSGMMMMIKISLVISESL
jgi:hypothetical protein